MEFQKGSSTPLDIRRPAYLDEAPDSRIVFPAEYSAAEPTPSSAKAKEITKGVYSHDPILDGNPIELWRFLVANLRRPRLAVLLRGTHTETTTSSATAHAHGPTSSRRVTDFDIQLDISDRIMPWSQLYAHRAGASIEQFGATDGNAPSGPTVRETVEEYTSSRSMFKEFRLRKAVLWDYDLVEKVLTDLARSTGYCHTISVTFPMKDYKVIALASNKCSVSANSTVVQVLCVVSCLWIVFLPVWARARNRMKNRLTCEYRSRQSAEEFLSRNCDGIRLAVRQRVRGTEEFLSMNWDEIRLAMQQRVRIDLVAL